LGSEEGEEGLALGLTEAIYRGNAMARDRKLAEVARSIHRASERLWARVVERDKYDVAPADVETLQRLTTELSRAITKLKLKGKK
jgi:ABC-type tungstate transport system substrate-binding protein